jgi:phage-related protein
MSNVTYLGMAVTNKYIVWLHGEIKTPPFGTESRLKAGFLMRRLQQGENLEMPDSRPMPSIGKNCHELRINDANKIWRIVYYIDSEAIVILEVFLKKSQQTPKEVIDQCKKRLSRYKQITGD